MESVWNWKTKTFLLALAFLGGSLPLLTEHALAAGPLPVAIEPTRIEFAANRGDHVTGTFSFWNGTNGYLPIYLEAADFAPQGEEGHLVVGGKEDQVNSLKAWVTPEVPPDLAVAPKQKIALDFAIDVPANADPGSHWGVLLVTTEPRPAGSGAAVQVKIGLILLVNVYGEAREKLTLESFAVPRFSEGPPVTIAARFRNEGTVHVKPQATIEVRDLFDRVVATSTLPERNVLPGTVRRIETKAGSGFWIGRYRAMLRASYGTSQEALVAQATFWVFPWRKVGLPFAIFLGTFVFIVMKRRQFGEAFYVLRTGKERTPRVRPASAEPPAAVSADGGEDRKSRRMDL